VVEQRAVCALTPKHLGIALWLLSAMAASPLSSQVSAIFPPQAPEWVVGYQLNAHTDCSCVRPPRDSALRAALLVVRDSGVSHRRAGIIGAVVGGVIGGLGSAGYILNATAGDCLTEVSAGSGCGHDSHVVLRTATIAAGTAVGAVAGAWIGRRVASRRAR
jgi:hypothetical protein